MSQHQVTRSMEIFARARQLIPGGTQLVSRRPTRLPPGVCPIYAQRAQGAASGTSTATSTSTGSAASARSSSAMPTRSSTTRSASRSSRARSTPSTTSSKSSWPRSWCGRSPVPKWSATPSAAARRAPSPCASPAAPPAATRCSSAATTAGTTGTWPPTCAPSEPRRAPLPRHRADRRARERWPARRCRSPTATADACWRTCSRRQSRSRSPPSSWSRCAPELPARRYLQAVAKLGREHGVMLIFDEVSSGFRPAAGRACSRGRRHARHGRLRQGRSPTATRWPRSSAARSWPRRRMFISSTYWRTTVRPRGGADDDPRAGAAGRGSSLREDRVALQIRDQSGRPGRWAGSGMRRCGGSPRDSLPGADPELGKKVATLFIQENARRGVILSTGMFLNCAHDEQAVARTVEVVRESMGDRPRPARWQRRPPAGVPGPAGAVPPHGPLSRHGTAGNAGPVPVTAAPLGS